MRRRPQPTVALGDSIHDHARRYYGSIPVTDRRGFLRGQPYNNQPVGPCNNARIRAEGGAVAGGVGEKEGDGEDEGNGEAEQRTRHGRRARGRTKQTQQSTRRGTHNNTHILAEGGVGVARGV